MTADPMPNPEAVAAAPGVKIFVDADACPVKSEIYKVARRLDLPVFVVSHSGVRAPTWPKIHEINVPAGADAADDWIAERIGSGGLCITADIRLAARCLKNGGAAIDPRGRAWSDEDIGQALANLAVSEMRREISDRVSGPPPFSPKDRSRFLTGLDSALQRLLRGKL